MRVLTTVSSTHNDPGNQGLNAEWEDLSAGAGREWNEDYSKCSAGEFGAGEKDVWCWW